MEIDDIHIGDRLMWTDPDPIEGNPDERPVTVVRIDDMVVLCQFDAVENGGYGEVEAYPHELSRRKPVVRLECRSNNYYEVVVDGEPTGQGSFDYNEAEDMKRTIEEGGLDV